MGIFEKNGKFSIFRRLEESMEVLGAWKDRWTQDTWMVSPGKINNWKNKKLEKKEWKIGEKMNF